MKNPSRSHRHLVIVSLITLLALAIPGRPGHSDRPMLAADAPVNLSKPGPARQGRVLQSYGKLPLAFEANQGQADARVKFLSRGAGYTLFLTGDEAVLALRGASRKSKPGSASMKGAAESSVFVLALFSAPSQPRGWT
ncbi:MAG TPA: hypothetical protein VGW33_00895 [Terriglobia bacterium]|nr:hypothetical protein [Terriglobia bacterium]